jgi:thiol-disulfide isomerase/thioredoxin
LIVARVTGPKLAIAMAAAVMFLLAVIAITVGYVTAPKDKRVAQLDMTGATDLQPARNREPGVTPGVIYTASFTDLDGKPQSLGQWQKKLLVINFWATWCAPCKEEMPIFAKLQQSFASNGVQFVGIAADSRQNVANFVQKTPFAYPLYPDESGAIDFSKRLGNRLGLLPHTVVVAPGGEVVYAKLGQIIEADFAAILQQNLPK